MNRREFAVTLFGILPSALSYQRTWKAVNGLLVPGIEIVRCSQWDGEQWVPVRSGVDLFTQTLLIEVKHA
jgi:hypothetical protein